MHFVLIFLSFFNFLSAGSDTTSSAYGRSTEIKSANESGLERYENFLEEQTYKCQELKIGETRRVSEYTPSGIYALYNLTRMSEKKYKVTLPIIFMSGDTHNDPRLEKLNTAEDINKFTDQTYRARVKKCLSETNNLLKDSNGMSLELSINDSAEETRKLNKNQLLAFISIQEPNYRSNAFNYSQNIDCAVIVHELLHLTGLCDEYKEHTKVTGAPKNSTGKIIDPKSLGYKIAPEITTTDFDCRTHPTRNTIMNNHTQSLAQNDLLQTGACICPTQNCSLDAKSENVFKDGYVITEKPVACPPGYTWLSTEQPSSYSMSMNSSQLSMLRLSPSFFLLVFKKINIDPPLATAHTRHIINPGCREKNKRYYRCSSDAYQSSVSKGCGTQVRDCNKDDSWLD